MSDENSMRLALVIPWFGRELKGGAEQQAWQIATRLAAKGADVTVLTTCSQQFLTRLVGEPLSFWGI